jgi:hypothetical protein
MKQTFAILLLILSVTTIQTSCKKTKTTDTTQPQKPPIALDSMLLCHGQTNFDSASTRNALIGKWQWKFIKCYWNPEQANGEEYKTISIEFKQNDSLEVKTNDQTTQKSSWKVTRLNDGYFTLTVSPIVYQLPGKVLFCGDYVLFYDTYTDGCDNYFKRVN